MNLALSTIRGLSRNFCSPRSGVAFVRPYWSHSGRSVAGHHVGLFLESKRTVSTGFKSTLASHGFSTMLGILTGDLLFNWAGFAVAATLKTEKYFDLTGSLTFVGSTIASFLLSPQTTIRKAVVSGMVVAWGVRLGSFLFYRISKAGEDRRFEQIRNDNVKFFTLWTGQGVWAFVALLPVLLLNASRANPAIALMDVIGWSLFAAGLTMETLADYQKFVFRENPENKGKFISSGLWAYSRHPNYFGEMMLWWGIFISCSSVLRGPQLLSVASPLFVMAILLKGTGLPILEADADKRWGADPAYQEYKRNTPVLVPAIKWDKPKQ